MLSETKLSLLQQLVQSATTEEIIWTKGYLAGYLDKNGVDVPIPNISETPTIAVKLLIIYGTETGNSKKIASQLLASFKKNKIQAKAVDVFQYDLAKLEKESLVLFVMSTQGEGEFPQNAVAFYEKLKASEVDLSKISFAVFGLGDSSYPLFCNAGVLLDEVLLEKGAKPLLSLVKADVDFAKNVIDWEKNLLNIFHNNTSNYTNVSIEKKIEKVLNKRNYIGIISHKVILNDRESNKETYHIEITSDDAVAYEPGDALGLIPKNTKEAIDFILIYFNANAKQEITIKDKKKTAEKWLEERNIKGLSKRSLDQIATLFETTIYLEKADLIDVLKHFPKPKSVNIDALIEILLPIAPRLYSISSSAEAHDGQVHLTVNLNKFIVEDEVKTGLASQFLADYPIDTDLEFYIHKNQNFRLPTDDTDVIMIGPGTGIAPFRSFLAHRDATGAEGKNWLFFGEQHFVLDFYYQTEIQEWISTSVLSKLSTAFSRDQEQKIYVQDRIRENSKDFNQWLESGASLYICGQKNPMSQDVEQAIVAVIAQERKISLEGAKQVLEELENQGKYLKDVY
ncbi:sulfite reductase flavoprotein subunit alpha [Flavobacterium sp.]|uniref:diflavin oxidoreductase n=1 Tax=Flavobacterium sp. TaxID=239 RepID=UPI0038FC2E28